MTAGVKPQDRPLDAILIDLRNKCAHPGSMVCRAPSDGCLPRRSDEVRFRASNELYSYILTSSRSLSAEAFNKVYSEIHARCFALVNSTDLQDKLAGVTAIGSWTRTCDEL